MGHTTSGLSGRLGLSGRGWPSILWRADPSGAWDERETMGGGSVNASGPDRGEWELVRLGDGGWRMGGLKWRDGKMGLREGDGRRGGGS